MRKKFDQAKLLENKTLMAIHGGEKSSKMNQVSEIPPSPGKSSLRDRLVASFPGPLILFSLQLKLASILSYNSFTFRGSTRRIGPSVSE
jgi:hypothetical protein